MAVNSFWKLAVWFAVFYFVQGTLAAYRTYEEPYLSIRFNLTLTDLAQSQAIYSTAWGLKPIQGWITDNWNLCGLGHRRPYAFLGPLVGGASFAMLPYIAPRGSLWSLYLFVIFMRSYGIAQMDAAVDGLLVDADVSDQGSMFQGVMMASRVIGELFTTLAGAPIAGSDVNPNLWFFMAAFTFIAVPFAFTIKVRAARGPLRQGAGQPAGARRAHGWESLHAAPQPHSPNSTPPLPQPLPAPPLPLAPLAGGEEEVGAV